jgi:imidazolonepropionase-like amidohydrolase
MRILKAFVILVLTCAVLLCAAVYMLGFWPLRDKHPAPQPTHGTLAITGARIYISPDAPAIAHGTIVMTDGRISAVGENIPVPANAQLLPCANCVVTAGFWNAHVHFTERKWSGAEWKPAAQLQSQIEDMLTSRGFTTVVDVGSNLRDTVPLRRRIEYGEIAGPKIYTAGSAIYPPDGIPFYLKTTLPKWMLLLLPQPKTPQAAVRVEERNITDGADVLKLFTGSYVKHGTVLPMPVDIARAAVEVAHRHGQIAFAHESNLYGVMVAIDSGVDVLAHAADSTEGVDDAILSTIVAKHMAMIPTLKMFATTVTTNPAYLNPIYAQVRRFHELGGQLIFGTDVGYMTDYTTTGEFQGLAKAGLSGPDILRMLTTAPAERLGVASTKGTIEVGKAVDLVVLASDPMENVTNFADVQTTVRNGRVIWQRPWGKRFVLRMCSRFISQTPPVLGCARRIRAGASRGRSASRRSLYQAWRSARG